MPRRRILVLGLCGLPGAGKSRLTGPLAERLDLRLVDRDAIRRAQFPLCAFSPQEKDAATDAALAAVVANCRLGFPTLVDGMTFSSRARRDEFRRTAAGERADFYVLHLECPPAEARRRVEDQPGHDAGDRDPELVDEVWRRFEPPEGEGLRLDATLDPDALLERAVRAVALLREEAVGDGR